MPREYQVKINVDSSAAEKKLLQFEQKAQRTFDKLNKTSFKPEAFINGINISITKVMELATKQEQAAAKIAQANAKVEQAQQKTAQVAIASNAKIEAEQAKLAAAAQKTAQAQIAATAKVTAEQTKAAAQQQVAAEKTAQATINANAKIVQSNNKLVADQVKASTQRQTAYLRSADVAQKAEAQIRTESEKTVQKQIDSSTKIATTRMQTEAKIEQADRKQQQSSQQTGNTVTTENEKMAASYTKLASTASTAWNQIKMVIGYAGVASMFRSALTEMKAMSDELVTYQKVTGATAAQMQQVRASAYQSAKQYGQSPSDYLANVAMMARAGYGQQSEAMANLATKTQLVGDMTAEMASKFLIAVDAGYRLNGNIAELEKVLNAANVADNNYATSLEQIAEGMTLIAPLAAGMNASVEETTAAIGAMQALTQRSGTEVARALRMIMINIAKDTETEVEEGFKLTEENIDSFNALLQEFAKEELAAADAAGKLLNPMKAIGALAKAWKSGKLNEQQLFSVLNDIGGARYTNNIMALVKNFDVYEEMLGKFATELTSANDEVNAMMDSWTRKLEVLKTSWAEMVNNRVSEDFIKGLLDMGTGFLNWTGNLENFIAVGGGAIVVIKQLWTLISAGPASVNPAVLAIGALVTILGAAKTAFENYKKSAQDASKTGAENAEKAYDQAKAINELVAAYNELAKDGTIDDTELEEARRIQDEINKLVEDLPEKYNLVNGSIESNVESLKKLNKEQLKAAKISAQEAVNTTGKALVDYGSMLGVYTGMNAEFAATRKDRKASEDFLSSVLGESSLFNYIRGGGGMDDAVVYAGKRTAEDILKGYDELSAIIDKATEQGLKDTAASLYYALIEARDNMKEVVENYRSAVDYNNLIQKEDFSKESNSSSGTGTGTDGTEGTGTNNAKKQAIYYNDAYAKSYDRLQAAIKAATDAQEKFNGETSTTKGDQLKFYGSALEAYNEELKAGRVNSTAFHAAARALMGEEAYNATGGYTQSIQAAMNATGSKGISLIDAITTLTAEYKNQAGEVREGAGLAVLLEKLGYNVKDSQGNYVVKMTEDMYKEAMAAIPGLTREMLENAANAYDQYDKSGRNTNIAPEEVLTSEEENTKAVGELNEATGENTTSTNENTDATRDNTAAVEQLRAAVDESTAKEKAEAEKAAETKAANAKAREENLEVLRYRQEKATEEDKALAAYIAKEKAYAEQKAKEQREKLDNIVDAVSLVAPSYAGDMTLASHKQTWDAIDKLQTGAAETVKKTEETVEKLLDATDGGMRGRQVKEIQGNVATMDDGQVIIATDKAPIVSNSGRANEREQNQPVMLEDWGNGMVRGLGIIQAGEKQQEKETEQIAATKENTEAVKELQKTVEVEKEEEQSFLSAWNNDTVGKKQTTDTKVQGLLKDQWEAFAKEQGANKKTSAEASHQEDKANETKDRQLAEEQNETVKQIADGMTKSLASAKENWALLQKNKLREAAAQNPMAAFKGNQEYVSKYMNATAAGDKAGADRVVDAYFNDVGINANVNWLNNEATWNDVQIAIEPILDQYSADQVASALEYLSDEERVAVIQAMVDHYSLSEVIGALKYTTEENWVAIINAEVDKNGAAAVAAELNKLSATERNTYIKALIDSGSYSTAQRLLNELIGGSATKQIFALLDQGSYQQAMAMLNSLLASETKTIYVQTVGGTTYTSAGGVTPSTNYNGNQATHTGQQAQARYEYGGGPQAVPLYPVGTKYHPGGLARVNDGTGAELILDSHGPYIANGGRDAVIDLEKGARVFTHEQTRQLLRKIPGYAMEAVPMEGGGPWGQAMADILHNAFGNFDAVQTGDTAYTQSGGNGGSGGKTGTNTSTGKVSTSGSGSGETEEDKRWEELKSLIEYILKRLGKALDAQEEIIDKQIQELEKRRSQNEEQNRLEELQKAVTEAQSNLLEAESQRSVRYLGDDGAWHWMADQKKVQQAKEELSSAQKNLQDYLNDLVIDAQIDALNQEKERLATEYNEYTNLWSAILDAVDTPQGELMALISSLTASGTGAQKNGVAAVRDRLISALTGGSYTANYSEALGEIAKATANNPSVPGVGNDVLAALVASSGTNVSRGAMMDALQRIAGTGTLAYGNNNSSNENHQDTYYYINGVQIGADMAELPMSEVLSRLAVFNNTLV